MRMNILIRLAALLLLLPSLVLAQELHHNEEPQNEIGIANSPVYMVDEDAIRYGLHIHYIRSLFEHFGLGLGYEKIFDPHNHQTIGVVLQFKPIHPLTFNIAPGFLIEGNDWSALSFSVHTEASWEFELGYFHLGPLVEVAYGIDDLHLSVGLHTGIPF